MSQHTFNVYTMFQANASTRPLGTAVVDQGRVITFEEIFNLVNIVAAWLSAQGIKPGDRIAILAMNRYEYLAVYGAAAALGVVTVPLNWRLSQAELVHIINDSDSKLLFFDAGFEKTAHDISAADNLKNRQFMVHDMTQIPDTASLSLPHQTGTSGPDDLFCLIYTAAVEGHPRGAALSHGNIIAANLQTNLAMTIGINDAYLNMLPLCHITGINFALSVMHMGGKNVIMEKFDALQAVSLIQEESVSILASFPPILSLITDEMDAAGMTEATHLRVIGIDSPDTIERFKQTTSSSFWVLYGQSETSGFVTLSDSSDAPGSAGTPGSLSYLSIRDETGKKVASEETGEICVRGPLVFQGYWSDQGLNTASFKDGWHYTGDLGCLDPRGYLWFKGRKPEKELIKPGGENVYPAEVEAVVLEHPDILATCVIGVPDPKFGEGIKAVCVKAPESNISGDDLIAFVAQRIARYKKPGYVEFVESLPTTGDGTIDRSRVKELYTA